MKIYAKNGTKLRDKAYLDWIRTQPCHVKKEHGPGEPDHGRVWGKGMRGPDSEALPLCRNCHRNRHDGKWMYGPTARETLVDYYNSEYCKLKRITINELRGI